MFKTFQSHPASCFCHECEDARSKGALNDGELDLVCEYVQEQVKNITNQVRKTEMINRSNSGSGSGTSKPRNGLSYLKNENLSLDKKRVKILDAWVPGEGEDNKYNNVVICKLEFEGGRKFLWGLKDTNPCLGTLVDEFGEDEQRWKNRDIYIFLEENPRDEKRFARVEIAHAAAN